MKIKNGCGDKAPCSNLTAYSHKTVDITEKRTLRNSTIHISSEIVSDVYNTNYKLNIIYDNIAIPTHGTYAIKGG